MTDANQPVDETPPSERFLLRARLRRWLGPAIAALRAPTRARTLTLIGSIVVLAAFLSWWFLRPPLCDVLRIQPTNVEFALSVVGRARPLNLVDVRSPNGGQVIRLLHDDGDVVRAGDTLAIVRASVEQALTDAGIARERAARAEVALARLAFTRTQTLAERGFASAAALDQARATLQSAEANLAAATADRRAATAQAREFTIRAPMSGVILVRPIDNGQVISSETLLFQLGSNDGVELQAEVDEAYADALLPGMAARAALSGSNEVFMARISEVSPRVDPTTGGRLVKLRPEEATALPPGRAVDITIVVERREDAIVIPRQALLDATTEPKVYIVDARGIVRERLVKIEDWPSLNAIITDGLAAGDEIVLAPSQTAPEARIRRRERPAADARASGG